VRLWLSVIAYNVGNLWRRLVLPKRIDKWSLTSLQRRLAKTGGRLAKHARYCRLLLAEGYLTRRLSASMVRRIELLPLPGGQNGPRRKGISDKRVGGGKGVRRIGQTRVSSELQEPPLGQNWRPMRSLERRRGLTPPTRPTIAFGAGQMYAAARRQS
jgi:hypothetical protein